MDNLRESAVTIRQSSTANLMIDSQDRNTTLYPTAGDFVISKQQNILNGFFTRIGTSEVVLDWGVPNISAQTVWGAGGTTANNTFSVNVTGAASNPYTLTLATNFYNVAQLLDAMVERLNTIGTGNFTVTPKNGVYSIDASGVTFYFINSILISQMGFNTGAGSANSFQTPGVNFPNGVINAIDLRTYTYLDFISQDLTYNQSLKDSSTNFFEKNVLCRFYMSYDGPAPIDFYGFPILPGYSKFSLRRLYSPCKQIAWQNNMPIGNLGFQVYGKVLGINTNYQILNQKSDTAFSNCFDWQMTLQVSEN